MPFCSSPSIVVMFLPSCIATSVMQDKTRRPSMCTVQAPHSPRSHAFLVPVSPRFSRNASSSVVRGSTAIVRACPLTVRFIADPTLCVCLLRKKRQCLAMQPGQLHHGPQTFAAVRVERNHLVLGNTVELAIGSKAQTAGPTKFSRVAGRENTNEMSAPGIVFPHRSHCVGCAERVLARHDDVPVGCNRQIKRVEFRVADQPDGPCTFA